MKQIEEIIRNTTEEEQEKVDWTKAWSTKYPVLATYQKRWLVNKKNELFRSMPMRSVACSRNCRKITIIQNRMPCWF